MAWGRIMTRERARPAQTGLDHCEPGAPETTPEYQVGYGRPPLHTRFQPGQSGKPRGRPRGSRNLKTELEEELQERIALREGGERRTVSKQRAMLKRLMEKALQDDVRAATLVISMVVRFLDQSEPEEDLAPLADGDRAILDAFLARGEPVPGDAR